MTAPEAIVGDYRVTVESDSRETCRCGTNDHLVVSGFSLVYRFDDRPAWAVRCYNAGCGATYFIDDEGRDTLFGRGWRQEEA